MPQRSHAVILAPEFDQSQALFQFGGGGFVPIRKSLQNFVVVLHRLCIVAASILHLGEIEIGVSGEISVGIELDVVGEFLRGKIPLARLIIA